MTLLSRQEELSMTGRYCNLGNRRRLTGRTRLLRLSSLSIAVILASPFATSMAVRAGSLDRPGHSESVGDVQSSGAGATADVAAVDTRVEDPPFSAGVVFYGLGAANLGPNRAEGVVFREPLPVGTVFDRIEVRSSGGVLLAVPVSTPAVGESGEIVCTLGAIDPDDYISVFIWLTVVAEPGSVLMNTHEVRSDTPDPNQENNTLTIELPVPYPPVVDSIKTLIEEGKPFRIRIEGSNFEATSTGFPVILIGTESIYWEKRKVTAGSIVLKGGDKLKRLFPRGEAVPIVIINFSGGQTTAWFVR